MTNEDSDSFMLEGLEEPATLAVDPNRRYAEAVNAPLSRATVVALRDRLKSGNYPRRKVRKRA